MGKDGLTRGQRVVRALIPDEERKKKFTSDRRNQNMLEEARQRYGTHAPGNLDGDPKKAVLHTTPAVEVLEAGKIVPGIDNDKIAAKRAVADAFTRGEILFARSQAGQIPANNEKVIALALANPAAARAALDIRALVLEQDPIGIRNNAQAIVIAHIGLDRGMSPDDLLNRIETARLTAKSFAGQGIEVSGFGDTATKHYVDRVMQRVLPSHEQLLSRMATIASEFARGVNDMERGPRVPDRLPGEVDLNATRAQKKPDAGLRRTSGREPDPKDLGIERAD